MLLVVSTLIVGTGASRLATRTDDWGAWAIAVGGCCIMWVSDDARVMQERADALAKSAKAQVAQARADVVESSRPRRAAGLAITGCVLVVLGLVAPCAMR